MKRKIGTVLDEDLLVQAKQRAAREHRALADVLHSALDAYLNAGPTPTDAERACAQFCSHGSNLSLREIDELLADDALEQDAN